MRGGTLIAEDVTDLARHEECLRSVGYRPPACPRCQAKMHVHGERVRVLLGSAEISTSVARFRCADRDGCGAVFLVLPAWIARHLWRAWATVEDGTREQDKPREASTAVPRRTLSRWKARLLASAAALIVALGGTVLGDDLAAKVGLGGARHEVVAAYASLTQPRPSRGLVLATLAAVVHRAAPGIRLM